MSSPCQPKMQTTIVLEYYMHMDKQVMAAVRRLCTDVKERNIVTAKPDITTEGLPR